MSAHQPLYLPWLGFFNKIYNSDIFCVLDDAQYSKGDFINRNRIKNNNGMIWLTVPVHRGHLSNIKINEIEISDSKWVKKHFLSIHHAYNKSKYYKTYIGEIERIFFETEYKNLMQLNMKFINYGVEKFDLHQKRIEYSSKLTINSLKSEYIVDLCQKLNSKTFIFGEKGTNYVDKKLFINKNIEIKFQNFKIENYTQNHGEFLGSLSFIDALFNLGSDSNKLIRKIIT